MLELLAIGLGVKAVGLGSVHSASQKVDARRAAAAGTPAGAMPPHPAADIEPRRLFEGELSVLSPLVARRPAGKRKARDEEPAARDERTCV